MPTTPADKQDGDWSVAPSTPLEEPPNPSQPMEGLPPIQEEKEFVEDDADPDKALMKEISRVEAEIERLRAENQGLRRGVDEAAHRALDAFL